MKVALLSAATLLAAATPWLASASEPRTVCSITVNSPDEKETFRKRLPAGNYRFVELVEPGRTDWLRSACTKSVRCDVLVVSGHFNAGETFYSDRVEATDHLPIDELERAACSGGCPQLFSQLKEVYLFGCESLNPDATKYSSTYGESGRERMRRVFANVPAIYGFSAAAPVGKTAGALLQNAFNNGAGATVATGRRNQALLNAFSKSSMTMTSGSGDSAARRNVCTFFDERVAPAKKLSFVHAMLQRDFAEARTAFPRIEKLLETVDKAERQSPAFTQSLAEISADDATRERFLAAARAAREPELRARMLDVAHGFAWLSPGELRSERLDLIASLLRKERIAFTDVDLACSLNADGSLSADSLPPGLGVGNAAIRACLGDDGARRNVIAAVGSPRDTDVQLAQAYLRHQPMKGREELRAVTTHIAKMEDPRAKIRALDTLGRHAISDREILEILAREFAEARTVGEQRALAEVFIRSDPKALPRPQLVAAVRDHRIRAADSRGDLVDVLMERLQ